jgi:hypothetical protein
MPGYERTSIGNRLVEAWIAIRRDRGIANSETTTYRPQKRAAAGGRVASRTSLFLWIDLIWPLTDVPGRIGQKTSRFPLTG